MQRLLFIDCLNGKVLESLIVIIENQCLIYFSEIYNNLFHTHNHSINFWQAGDD